jgi:hypothetical protein
MKVVAHACDEIVERRFVAVHRPLDESSLHPPLLADPVPEGRFAEYESRPGVNVQRGAPKCGTRNDRRDGARRSFRERER